MQRPLMRPTPRQRRRRLPLICSLLALLGATSGCSSFNPPQAWQKGNLARPEMTMDKDALEAAFVSHVHFSREAASGGDGVGGGGCGCN
jgi:hypothetical protein